MSGINVVWLKRDLRLTDHAPLWHACQSDRPVVLLYIIEPDYWQLVDTSARQYRFIQQSLSALEREVRKANGHLTCLQGCATDVFEQLHLRYGIHALYSHQETGNDWTFQRDNAVKRWCQQHQITWREYRPFAIQRGPFNRDHWDKLWREVMLAEVHPRPALSATIALPDHIPLSELVYLGDDDLVAPNAQCGGTHFGQALWDSFIEQRHAQYLSSVSSPERGLLYSSRLSPYLAYGCLSLRDVVQQTRAALPKSAAKRSLGAFKSRLHWHCHFMQKLETEPNYEKSAVHPDLTSLRSASFDAGVFQSWATGQTGVPFVDACMRFLHHYGWISFRMRAMLTAFSSYHLWQPWQRPAAHLARLFVDYEPGIHYPQIQMQSGTTGINPFRIYNPIKQGQKLDPNGRFIRHWLPELNNISDAYIHQPWLSPHFSDDHYPTPIVDVEHAAKLARNTMHEYYRHNVQRQHTQTVVKTHASRRRPTRTRHTKPSRPSNNQMELF